MYAFYLSIRWFVFGSAGGMISAILPLVQQYEDFYKTHDDLLPSVDFTLTWSLLIFSGFWFTLGSLAFLRAFEEPPRQAICYWYKHLQTDELLGAWCFMLGTAPALPYTLVYFLIDPTVTFLGALAGSGVGVLGSVVFVMFSYPTNQTTDHHKKVPHPTLTTSPISPPQYPLTTEHAHRLGPHLVVILSL